MKMNLECMKEMLFILEELLEFDSNMKMKLTVATIMEKKPEVKQKYHAYEMIYSLMKLQEAGYIFAKWIDDEKGKRYEVSDVTYEGHLYLDSIR